MLTLPSELKKERNMASHNHADTLRANDFGDNTFSELGTPPSCSGVTWRYVVNESHFSSSSFVVYRDFQSAALGFSSKGSLTIELIVVLTLRDLAETSKRRS
jgi:hypothetical protein